MNDKGRAALAEEIKRWLDDHSGGPGAEADLRTAIGFLRRIVAATQDKSEPTDANR